MVIKGNARGQAVKLALHLTRTDTNERMLVREFRGVVAESVIEALREMEAVATGSRSQRPFYHASINTRDDELMTDQQKARAIDRLEEELGLTGQPRVVVEHVKEGREHLHVAWCRIDGETMTAIPDSHNFRRHEIVSRELEREFGHARVQGAHHEREGVERPGRCPTHAEMQQAERSGITPQQAKARLRELWNTADSGKSFAAALEDAGWVLAQGDRRGFVALDPTGEVRAVNKDITGLTAAKVRERLADIDADRLPSVDDARQQIKARQRDRGRETVPEAGPPSPDRDDTIREIQAIQQDRFAKADREADELDEENEPQHRQARPRLVVAAEPTKDDQAKPLQQRGTPENDIRRALEALALTDPVRYAALASAVRENSADIKRIWMGSPVQQAAPTPVPDPSAPLSLSPSYSIPNPPQPAREARREAQPVPGKDMPRPPPVATRGPEIEAVTPARKEPHRPSVMAMARVAVREIAHEVGDRVAHAATRLRERQQPRQEPKQQREPRSAALAFPRPQPARAADLPSADPPRSRTPDRASPDPQPASRPIQRLEVRLKPQPAKPQAAPVPAPEPAREPTAPSVRQTMHVRTSISMQPTPRVTQNSRPAAQQIAGRAPPVRPIEKPRFEDIPHKSAAKLEEEQSDRLHIREAEAAKRQADNRAAWEQRVRFKEGQRELERREKGYDEPPPPDPESTPTPTTAWDELMHLAQQDVDAKEAAERLQGTLPRNDDQTWERNR